MQREKYTTVSNETYTSFKFISEGPKGDIKKMVIYQHWGATIYNLAFGDIDKNTGKVNDRSRSNNGDRDKVLATIAFTIFTFFQHYPDAKIIIQGSSQSRSRLYQIQLVLNLCEISPMFIIAGYVDGNWSEFEKGKNYDVFSISHKKNK